MPPRFDSLLDGSQGLGRDDDGDEDDDERDGSRLMFTESTSPPKRLPAAKTRESTTLDAELQELFTYIDAYQPQDVDIVQELKCFMPEYVPCIGDIDPMIKVDPPPSTFQPPSLGITTLDEPTPDQSDPAVLDLHLRAHHKSLLPNTSTPLTPTKIRAIAVSPSDAPQATKQLNQWIGAITTLHAHTPPVSVAYTHPQPDLDALMQAWPAEMEGAFAAAEGVPDPAVEMDVRMYARLVCGLVDVPVYLGGAGETGKMRGKGKRAHVEALHVLFELYREFRDSQHFGHREAAAPTMSAVGLPPAEGGKGGAQ
ncbi:intraflagellar transport complex B protein 46 C terminal-domain-containing protein [Fimicolochytrium jonesii]|uniref:intraflagellar transport complex B protein 46 C terminal-domain-containing protein n=1 Tax=Fimicolochytrium jonesii TaxID=1396493 RepID=UPI0022FE93C0|nr:intraflagellar transport complex B protein 46 C terminal-domain-containing protein [Fimicolochytrium jonesii]KAI8823146.1 intraflagellar transport complex B protein 46 C terminal-domain-containing protein [Fimicolochytrium jonesii]